MKCAIYARYSSDLQRPTSIEDQVRRCREFAERQGWTVVEEFVRFDEARTAATLAGRDGLNSLLTTAKKKPSDFDCLMVDDTSRLARYLPDVLSMNDRLLYNGVFIYAVAQRLDCRDKTSRPLLALHGMMDEQFLVSLGEKVHRGQEGRALKGLHPGGRCYGYRNVPIEDTSRTEKYGRFAVSGVRLEIVEVEAEVILRIFKMYGDGASQATIAKTLNAEGVLAPQPPRGRLMRAWCISSIHEILRNQRYRGVFVWNRTRKERNPETGRKTSRPRPESEWVRVAVPEWRIVSDELWERVEQQIRRVNRRFGSKQASGGFCRTERSRRYLFSGFLICGCCGSRIVIVSGSGKRGYVKYGCPSNRYRGVCDNSLQIRQDRLEKQLLSVLAYDILQPKMMEFAIQDFMREVEQRMEETRRQLDSAVNGIAALQIKKQELRTRAVNVTEAIAAMGHSPSLLTQLSSIESEIAKVDDLIAEKSQLNDSVLSVEDLKKFFVQKATAFSEVLRGDVGTAKQALAKHVQRLVLTPRELPDGPVFEAFGEVGFFLDEKERMLSNSVPGHRLHSHSKSECLSEPSLATI
jgi:site-specific DNA recombinase